MMNLAEYHNRTASLADYLPWAALVAPGIVLNKDGSFQRTARFRGPDLDSATPAELIGTTARLNSTLRRLGSGWAIFVEAQRSPATAYPDSPFPEAASALRGRARRHAAAAASPGLKPFIFGTLESALPLPAGLLRAILKARVQRYRRRADPRRSRRVAARRQ